MGPRLGEAADAAEFEDARHMGNNVKPALRQLALLVLSTAVALTIVLRTDLVSRLSYLVEKGRIRAMRESAPSAAEVEQWNARARDVARLVAPGVVQIVTEREYDLSAQTRLDIIRDLLGLGEGEAGDVDTSALPVPDDDAHRRLWENRELRVEDGYGSGFIVDADNGHIITNNHVIEHADVIRVYLSDGRRFVAELLGSDPKTDLAVIRIEADNLHELPLTDSDTVEVGDEVMAVGNPFRLEGTFSRGIISAKGRSSIDIHGIEYKGFLQTDAVINPGNSGGPLVNMRGEVIAVNTAIATESGHYDGVGFAIPSRRVIRLLPVLARGQQVVRGYLGVSITSAVDDEAAARALGWDDYHGVIVKSVLPRSPAKRSGLQPGDIILSIDGEKLRTKEDLIETIAAKAPHAAVTLSIWRDRAELTLTARIDRQPDNFSTRGFPSAER